jgi:hypothetical protein
MFSFGLRCAGALFFGLFLATPAAEFFFFYIELLTFSADNDDEDDCFRLTTSSADNDDDNESGDDDDKVDYRLSGAVYCKLANSLEAVKKIPETNIENR